MIGQMEPKMAEKCFGYTRVSGLGQIKGHGLDRQREIIAEFCGRAGYELEAIYEDAHTGTEADRPQFTEMLGAMMGNGVKVVVVESLDRLARDLMVQSTLLAKLAAEGLNLVAANTGENVTTAMQDDPMRKALVQIQGVFAELDKSLIVRKLRKGREAVRSEGRRCEGRKPFGFHDGEQVVLDRIRQLRRKPRGGERMPVSRLTEMLNAEGLRNRSGEPFTDAHVRKLIKVGKG